MLQQIKPKHWITPVLPLLMVVCSGPLWAADEQTVILPDGSHYKGELADGLFSGQGRLEYPDGSWYEGAFAEGRFHGQGHWRNVDGTEYSGQFVSGRYNGEGSYSEPDGESYRGQFKDGLYHGQGEYRWDDEVYQGTFVEGSFTGEGSYRRGEFRYQGDFVDWQFSGQGELVDEEGDRYVGRFAEDEVNGHAVYKGSDGSRYEGGFREGHFHGKGTYWAVNGDRYEGRFHWGKFHGEGRYYLAEPAHGVSEYSGRWRRGELISADVPAFVSNYATHMEKALYDEPARLEQALEAIRPGKLGVPEAYLLTVAGDGTQRVFSREVDQVGEFLQQRFGARLQTLALVNDRERIGQQPMATRTSIERALARIGAQMNRDEDLLLLYLTSHGSREHELVLRQKGLDFPDLPAEELARLIEQSGIRWKMVLVSSCYSGGFIPHLEDESSLVISSAAADRTSFGCRDDAELTDFARALFTKALPHTADWREAFAAARDFVAYWESERKLRSSNPQLFVGADFEQKLAQFEQYVPSPSTEALVAPTPVKRSRLAEIGTALISHLKQQVDRPESADQVDPTTEISETAQVADSAGQ